MNLVCDSHRLVFIVETDYMGSVCKCSCLFECPNPCHWVQGSLCILSFRPINGGTQILHIFVCLFVG